MLKIIWICHLYSITISFYYFEVQLRNTKNNLYLKKKQYAPRSSISGAWKSLHIFSIKLSGCTINYNQCEKHHLVRMTHNLQSPLGLSITLNPGGFQVKWSDNAGRSKYHYHFKISEHSKLNLKWKIIFKKKKSWIRMYKHSQTTERHNSQSINIQGKPLFLSFAEPAHLIVCTVLLATLATLEQIGGGSLLSGHLVIINGLFGELSSQLPHFITCHFLQPN